MHRMRTWLRVIVAACFGVALLQGGRAWAANFEVTPVRVALSQATASALLTVHNQSSEPLRFQVTAFTWAQGKDGEMALSPTDELVVFPTMFSIKAGESRKMRLGITAPPGGVEKTYRVFVEELPPPSSQSTNQIRVLTRMGIPVFQSPAAAAPLPRIDAVAVQGRTVSLALHNAGNAYFFAKHVRVSAVAPDGRVVFTRDLPGWYVLAGGLRDYTTELPDEACAATRLDVDLETESTTAHASAALPPRACPR
jgi:fimbrial chaperone protein